MLGLLPSHLVLMVSVLNINMHKQFLFMPQEKLGGYVRVFFFKAYGNE